MNLRYLKNDHDLAVQDSVKRIGASHFGEMWRLKMWERRCQFDDDSAFRLRVWEHVFWNLGSPQASLSTPTHGVNRSPDVVFPYILQIPGNSGKFGIASGTP